MKPILFNTEMVRAILDGRKTVTRRIIKRKYGNTHFEFRKDKYGTELVEMQDDVEGETYGKYSDGSGWRKLRGYVYPKPPYKKGDILYVRETWAEVETCNGRPFIIYKSSDNGIHADENHKFAGWRPSIHMPKEAARIFLRVTDVRVERLQDITEEQAIREGCDGDPYHVGSQANPRDNFGNLWNSTIKKQDIDKYGWDASPWVWVIEFERCEKPV